MRNTASNPTKSATLVVHHPVAGTSRTTYPTYAGAERAAQRARLNPFVVAVAFRPDRAAAALAFFNHLVMTEA